MGCAGDVEGGGGPGEGNVPSFFPQSLTLAIPIVLAGST